MIEKLKSLKLQFIHVLAILVLLATFAYFFWISGKNNPENHNIGEIKTAMISFCTMVLGYFFGSSSSSAKKDAVLQRQLEESATP